MGPAGQWRGDPWRVARGGGTGEEAGGRTQTEGGREGRSSLCVAEATKRLRWGDAGGGKTTPEQGAETQRGKHVRNHIRESKYNG